MFVVQAFADAVSFNDLYTHLLGILVVILAKLMLDLL